MREVNGQKSQSVGQQTCKVSHWSSVVRQLAQQAKRRSKGFYRRVKYTLLSPPAQSTLPVPTKKIQRILQRNTPWSVSALDLIPRGEGACLRCLHPLLRSSAALCEHQGKNHPVQTRSRHICCPCCLIKPSLSCMHALYYVMTLDTCRSTGWFEKRSVWLREKASGMSNSVYRLFVFF